MPPLSTYADPQWARSQGWPAFADRLQKASLAVRNFAKAPDILGVVEVENLSVRFVSRDLDLTVVNDVSFTLAGGEVLCLLGESGFGAGNSKYLCYLDLQPANPDSGLGSYHA